MAIQDSPDESWEYFGRTEPYYGVLTSDDYRRERLDPARLEEFFGTGDKHVECVHSIIRARLDPAFAPRRVLDFGCGVGRLVIPFARQAREVIGVDVSPSMLDEAKRNCEARGLKNVELVLSDDDLSGVKGPLDLVHSVMVFQHIPRRRGERIFRRLVELLAPGGVGALHFTLRREDSRARRLATWMRVHVPLANGFANVLLLRQPFGCPMMQMNEYDMEGLLGILRETGCDEVLCRFSQSTSGATVAHGVTLFFQKSRSAPAATLT